MNFEFWAGISVVIWSYKMNWKFWKKEVILSRRMTVLCRRYFYMILKRQKYRVDNWDEFFGHILSYIISILPQKQLCNDEQLMKDQCAKFHKPNVFHCWVIDFSANLVESAFSSSDIYWRQIRGFKPLNINFHLTSQRVSSPFI